MDIRPLLLVALAFSGGAMAQVSRKSIPPIVATITSAEIADFDANPPAIKKLLEAALALTRQNLGYQYGADDPAEHGMDCSGTVYYLLRAAGVKDVPRSSAEQYAWVQEAGTFIPMNAHSLEAPEFSQLRPGDLLFWSGTYPSTQNLPATHAMIYLGKAATDALPLMVGSSDGRTYRGKKCYGVSVFDFYLPREGGKSRFLGYAKIPGLPSPPVK